MPQNGYKVATLRESVYALAEREAGREGISVAEFISRAIEGHVYKRRDLAERVRTVIEALDASAMPRSSPSPSSPSTPRNSE